MAKTHPAAMADTTSAVPMKRRSYVDWSAVLAGALIAIASAFVLMTFGATVGLSFVSPWTVNANTAAAVGTAAVIWFTLVQIYSYGMGAYVCGRMRPPAGDATADEVMFRDNLNGLLVWALGVALSALLISTTVASLARGVAQAGTAAAATAAEAHARNPNAVFDSAIDFMFRPSNGARPVPENSEAARAEVGRIFTSSVFTGDVSAEDKAYLAQIVSARTGLPPQEAGQRVDQSIARARDAANKARDAAESARKAAVTAGFWGTLVLLLAALTAWWAGGVGGRHRDEGRVR